MITAIALKQLTSYNRKQLAWILAESGYKGVSFESVTFLGITNGGEFCYKVTFFDDGGGPEPGPTTGKVFVKYDPTTNKVSADY